MKIAYVEKNLRASSRKIVDQANVIIEEYSAQGYSLTLRQLYYQFVSRDLIANTMKEYKRLGKIINMARLVGLIDWNAIVDMTRSLQRNSHWDSPQEIVESCESDYQIDKWEGQKWRPEVWIEKDALMNILEPPCSELDVSIFSCRGYVSQSAMWRAANRLSRYMDEGQAPVIIHLGDHDPSGIDMTRDIQERLELFIGDDVRVERIALNKDQIREHKPPPNPAKITDSRFKKYVKQHGKKSWELDALEPSVLDKLVREEIISFRNDKLWKKKVKAEKEDKKLLSKAADWIDGQGE